MSYFLRRLAAPLPSLAAVTVALTTLVSAGPADARTSVRGVKATVNVANATGAWSLRVRLAAGTRLLSVSGGKASARRGTIVVTPQGGRRTLTLVTRGAAAPKAWSIGSQACAVKRAGRRGTTGRLTVTCAVPGTTASGGGALPTGGGSSAPAPTGDAPTPSNDAPAAGGPIPTPTPAPSPVPTPPAPDAPAPYRFAPYADVSGAVPPDLAGIRAASGVDHISLGFVVKDRDGGCDPTWGGYTAYPATGSGAYQRAQVLAFRQSGGDVVVSFGGAAGTELALACDSADALAVAYQSVIDAYGVTRVDFDIEGAIVTNTTANTNRAQAIAKLQRDAAAAGRTLVVTYTLQTDPTGLTTAGKAVVEDVVDNGVDLAAVNIMAMDYDMSPNQMMGALAIQAGTALHTQLAEYYPELTSAQLWRKVGVTPMIGINDYNVEIFTLQDAQQVAAWATANQIGMLAMWSLGRDKQCATPVTTAQYDCSGVTQSDWDFSKALGAFTG